jgi:hypothetical protein
MLLIIGHPQVADPPADVGVNAFAIIVLGWVVSIVIFPSFDIWGCITVDGMRITWVLGRAGSCSVVV